MDAANDTTNPVNVCLLRELGEQLEEQRRKLAVDLLEQREEQRRVGQVIRDFLDEHTI